MAEKILRGKTEEITYSEAFDTFDKARTEFLYYMKVIVDEATDDDDERANIEVNLAQKLGNLLGACELAGVLEDEDVYLSKIPYNEGAKIERVV